MSNYQGKMTTRNTAREGVVNQRRNNSNYENTRGKEKYFNKGQRQQEPMKKPNKSKREILDNFRYLETNEVIEERRKSIVRHRRLGSPVGKETPFRREDYNSSTYQISNRPNLKNINSARASYNPRQNNLLLNSNDSSQSSINYKFQSQPETLIFGNTCQKPKRPKGMQGGSNYQSSRKSVTRQIIGEQNAKGEYIIRYADEQNMNDFGNEFRNQNIVNERRDIRTENTKIRGAPQTRFDEGFNANPNAQYCPIHGYI